MKSSWIDCQQQLPELNRVGTSEYVAAWTRWGCLWTARLVRFQRSDDVVWDFYGLHQPQPLSYVTHWQPIEGPEGDYFSRASS